MVRGVPGEFTRLLSRVWQSANQRKCERWTADGLQSIETCPGAWKDLYRTYRYVVSHQNRMKEIGNHETSVTPRVRGIQAGDPNFCFDNNSLSSGRKLCCSLVRSDYQKLETSHQMFSLSACNNLQLAHYWSWKFALLVVCLAVGTKLRDYTKDSIRVRSLINPKLIPYWAREICGITWSLVCPATPRALSRVYIN